jgi:hypothetical protein
MSRGSLEDESYSIRTHEQEIPMLSNIYILAEDNYRRDRARRQIAASHRRRQLRKARRSNAR